jgi:hypothetical protein
MWGIKIVYNVEMKRKDSTDCFMSKLGRAAKSAYGKGLL